MLSIATQKPLLLYWNQQWDSSWNELEQYVVSFELTPKCRQRSSRPPAHWLHSRHKWSTCSEEECKGATEEHGTSHRMTMKSKKCPRPGIDVCWRRSGYLGAAPCRQRQVMTAGLNMMRSGVSSWCKSAMPAPTWEQHGKQAMMRVAPLIGVWSHRQCHTMREWWASS